MSIMLKLIQKIPEGTVYKTPSRKKEFTIDKVYEKGVSVLVGQTETPITIPSSCFEGVPKFLREKGWIRIGAVHDVPFEGSFESYVQSFTHGTSASSYVVPILEKIGIIEVDRKRPSKIRLKTQ
jgi:hypothetical protein